MDEPIQVSPSAMYDAEQKLAEYVESLTRVLAGGVERHMIRVLGDLQRLEVKPGDRFVLMSRDPLSPKAVDTIQGHWRNFAGPHVPLFILDAGMTIGVVGGAS